MQVDRFSKGEKVDESVLADIVETVTSTAPAAPEPSSQPPVKKFKKTTNGGFVSLLKMRERNAEFDRCLLPEERNCQELR